MGVKPRTILQTLDEVCGYYPLVEHFYRLKAQAFGRRRLSQADIYAPWRPGAEPVPYGVAVSCLRRAAADLNPQWGRIVGEVFDQGRIHAVVARGKRPGAFCYCRSPALPPYIALPYSGGLRDVFILAHELGHAVHYRLAAGCSYLNFRSPQVLEETAATLFELLAAHQFIQHEGLGVGLMELLAVRMEGLITTIFRQAALSRFEISLHDTARSQVLDENKINALWRKAMQDLFGQALINDPLQSSGWILVPHFFMRPFTCHNYVLGNLAALSLFRGYLEGGPSYLQEVNRMLAAGGTASPRQLLAEAGVGLGRSGAVRAALGMVAGFLEEFEQVLGLPENVHREG